MTRKALGKGLGALIPGNITGLDASGKTETTQSGNSDLAVKDIRPNQFQPRHQFSAEELKALADSIREQGILQPIVVRKAADGDGYELIAG